MTELSLTLDHLIAAPVERVYSAWLDSATLARFMIPCEGGSVPSAVTDARVGGRFAIVMRAEGRDIPHAGTYLELTPYSRIRFTWESPHSLTDSEVTLDFAADRAGTRITLTQVKFRDEASRDGHTAGWRQILGVLATAILQEA